MIDIYNITNGETTLDQWINYWTYCESANASDVPALSKIGDYSMITQQSSLFCGSMELFQI